MQTNIDNMHLYNSFDADRKETICLATIQAVFIQ